MSRRGRIPFDAEFAINQVRDYAIFVTDADGHAASWNEGVERVLGWREEEWIGQPARVIFPPEDAADAQRELEQARAEGSAGDDRWLMRRDGTRFFARGVTTAIRKGGRHMGFMKVLRDQTRQHEQEIALAESRDQLQVLTEALRASERRKDEFLATLAHELRNPLAPLRTGLQILRHTQGDPTIVEDTRAMMERQLGYLVHLVDDLMDIGRITHGKLRLRRQFLSLSSVIESAVEVARGMIEAEGHEFATRLTGEPVRIEADLTRLTQVFANLLINAAKYTPRGGRIELRSVVDGGEVAVSVSDTGIGLASDAIDDVFEMFAQARPLHTPPGLGIGLALARALVEMHGGTIEGESAGAGLGSTFTVRLPLAAGPTLLAEPDAQAPRVAPGAPRRVLVADDNRDAAESLAALLRMSGHVVKVAHDGVEAVTAAEEFRPEIALLDIGMPRMDGLEAARRLQGRDWASGLTLIALTGRGQDADRERSRMAGFHHHLVKPVDADEVQRLLGQPRDAVR